MLSPFAAKSQQGTEQMMDEITTFIRSGDAEALSVYFGNTLDLTLTNNEGTYSKTQATLILKDFFANQPVKTYVVNHKGSSDSGSLYMIGTYSTGIQNFRTYILIKKIEGTYFIQQIQFEKE